MQQLITGIHHITALADRPQRNINFYTGVLGMRLVKKTVNFDAPDIYHLYYGNETGDPGTLLTFFLYEGIQGGRHGKGMIGTTGFSVAAGSAGYWQQRLRRFNVEYNGPVKRFQDETALYFQDPDGLGLELVFTDGDARPGFTYGHIPPEHSIKGFYHAEIRSDNHDLTAAILTDQLDHRFIGREGSRYRFAPRQAAGSYIDVLHSPDEPYGLGGGGTVHHIAFCTPDRQSQVTVRNRILERMLNPTPVIDRQYFHSIYFREPGRVLFEVATDGPGCAIDEDREHLGETLKLPPQYEPHRSNIEKKVSPVQVDLTPYR